MSTLRIDVITGSTRWKAAFPRQKKKIEQAAALAYLMAKKPAALKEQDVGLTITLGANAAIRKLNRTYRGKDKPTNVLSFPQLALPVTKAGIRLFEGRELPLGDVVLAFETIKREAREQKKPIENHVIHLIVHGVLHLLGYDHMSARDAKSMEKLECDILAVMGYPDPYHALCDS